MIGFQTAYNEFLLKRFHRDDLSMQQAVMLAVYLVMRSKLLDEGVGGETRVAIIRDNGAWIDDPEYIANSEQRVKDFMQLSDSLFLDSIDLSIPPSEFSTRLDGFRDRVTNLRNNYLRYTSARSIDRMFHDPDYHGEPYRKVFLGAITSVSANQPFVEVREISEEERAKIRAVMELAAKNPENRKEYEFPKLVEGRQIVYLGNEKVTLHPKPTSTG